MSVGAPRPAPRSTRRPLTLAVSGAFALGLAGCGGTSPSQSGHGKVGGAIAGAGATLPQPVYDEWARRFKHETGTAVAYRPIGSGGGIAQFAAGTVDFGASDVPLGGAEIRAAEKKGAPVHVPSVLGAVAVAYHVAGVAAALHLDGATVADIFRGRIRRWNDRRIRALNRGRRLPGTAITVVHRSDESGTTRVFTTFLSRSSAPWRTRVGSDKSVGWPVGVGAQGSTGVAAAVRGTNGAVGYVAQAYALANGLATADVRNRAGRFVAPTPPATIAATTGVPVPPDLRLSAIDESTDPRAYPIATATFLLVYRDMCKAGIPPDRARRVVNWLHYALGRGQAVAPELGYGPLPDDLLLAARRVVAAEVCHGAPIKPDARS